MAPANDAVEYEIKVFAGSFTGDKTIYQGKPNDANNAASSDPFLLAPANQRPLSRWYQSHPNAHAAQLVNKTVRIPKDPGHYIVGLSVFHQLHCLNMVRQAMYATVQYPGDHELLGMEHIDHCIDTIRQNLMCNADVSVLVWEWDESSKRTKEIAQIAHTCRDRDKIRQWGMDNRLLGDFDFEVHALDDPLDMS
ncbi:MAG: hypothetical protein M1838_001823 [Thelocarpon superellum]|nr:MAG: hypothetical protein M1838_001823 [Thelocarpon superellum]